MRTITFAAICCIAFLAQPLFSQGLIYENPRIEGFHPLDQKEFASPLNASRPAALQMQSTIFSDTSIINFENRQITFMRTDPLGFAIWAYHYSELTDYLLSRNTFALRNNWHERVNKSLAQTDDQKTGRGVRLHLELPVHYPKWAQRLLGTEPPSLSVSGSLTMTIKYDDTRTDLGQTEGGGGGLEFSSESQFSITGSVGRLISLRISASSGDGFDFGEDQLKNFKIEYAESTPGELEDEIIQEIVAGYTGFDMPGTSLSGYSERHDGLFGIKVRSKLGPLMLTTIMSHAQSEVEKLTAERQRGTEHIRENEYVKNRFFFLDTVYRRYYNQRYNYSEPQTSAPLPPQVDQLQIFRRMNAFEKSAVERNPDRVWFKATTGGLDFSEFELLRRDRHYYLDATEGWIRFHDSVFINDNNLIAYSMTTRDGTVTKGQLVDASSGSDTSNTYLFAVLKPGNMPDDAQQDSTYHLMWRNVYRISTRGNRSDLRLNFLHVPTGTTDTVTHVPGTNNFISDVLGVSENNVLKVTNERIVDWDNGYLIVPPFDSSFHGNEPFSNPDLKELADTTIYRFSHTSPIFREYRPKFRIRTSGTVRGTSYTLGWGVMRGTVRVTAGGVAFQENVDYVVNYDMGSLELISPSAINAENVEIEYQRESLFVPEKKWFMGTRAELQLPFISERSFAAMNMLFQGSSSIRTPQLGSEPHSKMLLNFNTRLDFEPEWMTGMVNLLPLINTTKESSALFDFEVAYSNMNPNRYGSAYLDNFERVRRSSQMSMSHRSWHMASFPFETDNVNAAMLQRPPAWDFYWFTPIAHDDIHRVTRQSMWQDDPDAPNRGREYVNVMRLHATPAHPEPQYTQRFQNAYAAIMAPFHSTAMDLSKAEYLEILVKPEQRTSGKGNLILQIGQMKEDQVRMGGPPNQQADAEDPRRRGDYREELDLGLNGLPDSLEYYLMPNADQTGWDTLWYGDPLLRDSEDPAGDNWREYSNQNTKTNYRYVNGTQNNFRMDSEDLLNNGEVRIFEDERYYSYTIDLDEADNPFIVDSTTITLKEGSGWRLYRIPIKDVIPGVRDSVNNPSWRNVDMVRLVWSDFGERNLTRENQLVIGKIEFVGSEWEIEPAYLEDSTEVKKIEPSIINNQENMTYRESLRGESFEPKTTREGVELNSALKLNFFDLMPGDTALVSKDMGLMPQDISAYDSLTLFIYGDALAPYNNEVRFVFRFGGNDSTYYEHQTLIHPQRWNKIAINLKDISALKLGNDINNQPIDITSDDGSVRIVAPANQRPNFSHIAYMALGVIRTGGGVNPLEGEIWVNEMKVTGARQLSGWASRTSLTTQWADFMNLSATMDYTNADFRRMVDSDITPGDSRFAGSFNANANLDKFLPEDWGVSLPVGATVSSSFTRPQQKPGTDVFLMEDNKPDGLRDMAGDALNSVFARDIVKSDTTKAQQYERQSVSKTAYASYSRNNVSSNPVVNMTADRIGTEVRYQMNANRTARGKHADPDSAGYVSTDTTTTYTGKLTYDLSPNKPPSWRPFQNTDIAWLPQEMKRYQLNLLPRTMKFDLAELTYEKRRQLDTEQGFAPPLGRTFNLRHGMDFNYSPIDPLLRFNYGLNIYRDLTPDASFVQEELWDSFNSTVLKMSDYWDSRYMILHGEQRRAQTARVNFDPHIFKWLTHGFEYSATYGSNLNDAGGRDAVDSYNASVQSNFKLNTSFHFNRFFEGAGSATSGLNFLSDFFKTAGKGFSNIGLRSVSYTYETGAEFRNHNIASNLLEQAGMGGLDFLKYQLGVKNRSWADIFNAHIDDYGAFGGMHYRGRFEETNALYRNDYRTGSTNSRIATQFTIPQPLEIRFTNISLGWGENFRVSPDTAFVDTSIVLPEFRISASTPDLLKIGFLQTSLQRINLNSGLNYRKTERLSSSVSPENTTLINWSPLVGLDGQVRRWPINFNYRHNYSVETKESNEVSVDLRRSNVFTLNYEFSQSSALQEIKLFNWVVPVRGRTTVGMRIMQESELLTVGQQEPIVRDRFSLEPEMSYVFTDNVTGRLFYTFLKRDSEGTTTKSNIFALSVTITL